MIKTPTLIIGAGPAGLAVAGRMRKAGLKFDVIEQTNNIANAWHNHYDRLHLHTVKQLSHLPHMPFPESYPTYIPRQQLVDYYKNYAETFQIQPHFGASAASVKKEGSNWITKTKNNQVFQSQNVVVATGINRIPRLPKWKGQESFTGTIFHAKSYKNAQPFAGQQVLIIGFGNTGAEIALDLSQQGCKTYISIRSPIHIVPRDLNGRPVQLTGIQLAKIPFGIGDWIGNFIRGIYLGDLSKYGIKSPKLPPAKQIKITGKTPVIDIGTVKQIKAGKIKIMPDVDFFDKTGVVFKNGERKSFNTVILATGYTAQIANFLENTDGLLNKDQLPKQPISRAENQGLYFVGFDNYKLGGILGTIFTESKIVIEDIQERL